jgi:hypothetical protein
VSAFGDGLDALKMMSGWEMVMSQATWEAKLSFIGAVTLNPGKWLKDWGQRELSGIGDLKFVVLSDYKDGTQDEML